MGAGAAVCVGVGAGVVACVVEAAAVAPHIPRTTAETIPATIPRRRVRVVRRAVREGLVRFAIAQYNNVPTVCTTKA